MFPRTATVALALWASTAFAQTYVATTVDGVPYPALTTPLGVNLVAAAGTPNDRGRATIPIGFTFPFYDRQYTQVTVTANGVLFFQPSSAINQTSDFLSNLLGSVAEPNGVLAPFWDDLDGNNPASALQTEALTGPNGQGLAVEFKDWNRRFGTYVLTFQVRLWENGLVEYYYGDMLGSGGSVSASCGIESPTTGASVHCPCGQNNNCQVADLPTGRRITFGPAAGADLLVRALRVNSITPSGGDLQVDTTLEMRNFGTVPATGFGYRLFLSADTFYSPGTDVELTPTPQGPFTLNPLEATTHNVVTTAPAPTGSFYVLAVLDEPSVVAESNELNNLAATPTPYIAGVDLVAQTITGPPTGGPGEQITNTVVFSNQGVSPAGNVPVKIWLSLDNVLGPGDVEVYSGTIPVAGGQNVSAPVNYALPTNVRAGDYVFILQLDDGPAAGAIAEASDANNLAVSSGRFTARQADLVVEVVSVRQPQPPWGIAPEAYFGEPIRVQVQVKNTGGATAPNVSVLAFLSDNDTLNAVTDTFIGEVNGLTLAPGQTLVVDVDQPVPTQGAAGQTLLPAQYFFFGAAVSQGLVEQSATNNFLKSEPTRVRDPAPDLVPTVLAAPATVGRDELVTVSRTLANVGNRPASVAKYRYYLSANTIITPDDVPLPIVDAAGVEHADGQVTLAVGERSVANELVRIPPEVGAARWYLGVLLDPDGAVAEIDEGNNGLAGQSVDVVPGGLRIDTPSLPDGVLDAPYDVVLSAAGGTSGYTWEVRAGTSLPPGLALSPAGVLSGVPTAAGAFGVNVAVRSGAGFADASFVLRVAPVTATLAVTTTRLPPAGRYLLYDVPLAAVGGRAPYRWVLVAGALPEGITLESTGRLAGICSAPLGSSVEATFRVIDAVGNTDERALTLTVVDPSAVRIEAAALPAAQLDVEYTVDVLAKPAPGVPLARPLSWAVASGVLPVGLELVPSDDRLLISGVPREAGLFEFTLQLQDAVGRVDSRELALLVVPRSLSILGELPVAVAAGQDVSVRLTPSVTLEGATFRLRDGALPPGLEVQADGTVAGQVSSDAPERPYTFTVAYGVGAGATFRAFSVAVDAKAARALKGCGCQGAGGLEVWAALAALAAFARRRR